MEILPGIHQIDGVNGNCYILAGDGLTLIDTGLPGAGRKFFLIYGISSSGIPTI
jgi:hypothetical protein